MGLLSASPHGAPPFTHSPAHPYLLSTYYTPGAVLGEEDAEAKKAVAVLAVGSAQSSGRVEEIRPRIFLNERETGTHK